MARLPFGFGSGGGDGDWKKLWAGPLYKERVEAYHFLLKYLCGL